MLGEIPPAGRTIRVRPISLDEVREVLQSTSFTSAVGHSSTAEMLSTLLGLPVEARRVQIALSPGDRVIIFQLLERLPEGAVLSRDEVQALYERGRASFYVVEVVEG